MRKNAFLLARVAGLFIAAALLASCYAPLANQSGHLGFNLQIGGKSTAPFGISGTSQAVVLVVDSSDKAALAEILYLISKSKDESSQFSGSDADRLKTLAKEIASSGLVKIGGYPFFLVSLNNGATSGSFDIPGIPAGRSYFVKLFVLNSTVSSFTAKDVDQNFWSLIQYENMVFDNENAYNPLNTAPWQTWQSWAPVAVQPVPVTAGASAPVTVSLISPP